MRLLLITAIVLVSGCDQSTGLRTGGDSAGGTAENVQAENRRDTADDVANKDGAVPVSITGTMLTIKLSRECIGNCSTIRLKAILSKPNVALTDGRWQTYAPPTVSCTSTSDRLTSDCAAPSSAPIKPFEVGAKFTAKADGKEISATVGNVPGLKLILFRTSSHNSGQRLVDDPESTCHEPSWITSLLGADQVTSFTWADSQHVAIPIARHASVCRQLMANSNERKPVFTVPFPTLASSPATLRRGS